MNLNGSLAEHASNCSQVMKSAHHSVLALPFPCFVLPAATPEGTLTSLSPHRVSRPWSPALPFDNCSFCMAWSLGVGQARAKRLLCRCVWYGA